MAEVGGLATAMAQSLALLENELVDEKAQKIAFKIGKLKNELKLTKLKNEIRNTIKNTVREITDKIREENFSCYKVKRK